MKFEIIRICTGRIKEEQFHDFKPKKTAFNKTPIEAETYLSKLGLEGDEHAYHGHGGVNKAICLYDYNDYELWHPYIKDMPEFAAFGENITTRGLTKDNLSIGDTFQLGTAVIQVSEGRGPCSTIAQKYNVPNIVKMMSAAHATGCYFRVLEEGLVSPDSQLVLLQRDSLGFTIEAFNTLMYSDQKNIELLNKAVQCEALSSDIKEKFHKRLLKLTT